MTSGLWARRATELLYPAILTFERLYRIAHLFKNVKDGFAGKFIGPLPGPTKVDETRRRRRLPPISTRQLNIAAVGGAFPKQKEKPLSAKKRRRFSARGSERGGGSLRRAGIRQNHVYIIRSQLRFLRHNRRLFWADFKKLCDFWKKVLTLWNLCGILSEHSREQPPGSGRREALDERRKALCKLNNAKKTRNPEILLSLKRVLFEQ